jgi:hypothetical protein
MAKKLLLSLLGGVVLLGTGGFAILTYLTSVPGQPHQGALPALTAEERTITATLKHHVETIGARAHNIAHYDELEKVASYLEATLKSHGYVVGRQEYIADGRTVRNIDVVIEPPAGTVNPEVIVVGAHYDSAEDAPGANDNGSGTAAVLELARLLADLQGKSAKRIRLVLFVNEEPPYFQTSDMGACATPNCWPRAKSASSRCFRWKRSATTPANQEASTIRRRSE